MESTLFGAGSRERSVVAAQICWSLLEPLSYTLELIQAALEVAVGKVGVSQTVFRFTLLKLRFTKSEWISAYV